MDAAISTNIILCLQLFNNLVGRLDAEIDGDVPTSLWKDELGRLRVWAGNIGAHQSGQASLDYRLRDASHIKGQITNLLEDLQTLFKDAEEVLNEKNSPLSDHDTAEAKSLLHDLRENSDIRGLNETDSLAETESELQQIYYEIADATKCLLKMSMLIRRPARHDRVIQSRKDETAVFEPFDREHVSHKFPNAENSIIDRLGLAITRRRQDLKYRERHHAKLSKGVLEVHFDPPSETEKAVGPDRASTVMSPTIATDFVGKHIDFEDTSSNSGMSQTSYAPSIEGGGTISVPPPPKESVNEQPFECPYCYFVITIKSRKAWTRHVFRDVMPYSCVFLKCHQPSKLYESRREWFDHEVTAHLQHTSENLANISCPLCKQLVPSQQLERHLGRHLEELALFVVPHDYFDEDAGSNNSDADIEKDVSDSGSEPELQENLSDGEVPNKEGLSFDEASETTGYKSWSLLEDAQLLKLIQLSQWASEHYSVQWESFQPPAGRTISECQSRFTELSSSPAISKWKLHANKIWETISDNQFRSIGSTRVPPWTMSSDANLLLSVFIASQQRDNWIDKKQFEWSSVPLPPNHDLYDCSVRFADTKFPAAMNSLRHVVDAVTDPNSDLFIGDQIERVSSKPSSPFTEAPSISPSQFRDAELFDEDAPIVDAANSHRDQSRSSSFSGADDLENSQEDLFRRKGKTRIPKHLAHKAAILDLGYPYEERGDVVVIQKTLEKEKIDELVSLSKIYAAESREASDNREASDTGGIDDHPEKVGAGAQEAEHAAKGLEEAVNKVKADNAATVAAAQPSSPKEKKAPIRLKDAVGRIFSFPFHLCEKWASMEDLICQAFLYVDVIGPHVQEGHYDLVGPNNEIILPQVWETIIEPGMTITMHMWPVSEELEASYLSPSSHGVPVRHNLIKRTEEGEEKDAAFFHGKYTPKSAFKEDDRGSAEEIYRRFEKLLTDQELERRKREDKKDAEIKRQAETEKVVEERADSDGRTAEVTTFKITAAVEDAITEDDRESSEDIYRRFEKMLREQELERRKREDKKDAEIKRQAETEKVVKERADSDESTVEVTTFKITAATEDAIAEDDRESSEDIYRRFEKMLREQELERRKREDKKDAEIKRQAETEKVVKERAGSDGRTAEVNTTEVTTAKVIALAEDAVAKDLAAEEVTEAEVRRSS